MKNILMYCHNGSGNHGCEAIIRSTVNILNRAGTWQYYQISRNMQEDLKYGVGELVELLPEYGPVERKGYAFWKAYLEQKLLHKSKQMDYLSCRGAFQVPKGKTISLSIGGDNYCYKGYKLYMGYHQISKQQGHKTALWGCSVEPDFLEYQDLLNDLKTFDKIFVRESISYEAMAAKGLKNIVLYPDPAFTLEMCSEPTVIPPENTVGINISPMALDYGSENSDIMGNYEELIRYILQQTDMNIALIPHVVWSYNDDRIVLRKLKNKFAGESRVFMIEDMDCTCLKLYISKLRFLVGARTHATIAAYSTGVPTLVAGYSVKSRGIARDIFGTEDHYVVPVNRMSDTRELTDAFLWIMEHEQEIREHLHKFMPEYICRAYDAGKQLCSMVSGNCVEILKSGISKESCSGCSACVNACPIGCLQMVPDKEGFLYPEVTEKTCVNCGKCEQSCPIQNKNAEQRPKQCYAMKNKNETVRLKSSSGGVFSILANHIIADGGAVYGAAFDDKGIVRHIEVTHKEQLGRLLGAKYSQSVIGTVYKQVEKRLVRGEKVLFSGTPCQVAGLKSYLKTSYENLFCVDIICHGVPSPSVWETYLKQKSCGSLPQMINFRCKDSGWSRYQYSLYMEYKDGTVFCQKNSENLFLQGMVKNLFLRPSCSSCSFKGFQHLGDITLGDFWGIWNLDEEFDDNKGVSAVLVNTAKGMNLLTRCMDQIEMKIVTLEEIKRENLSWIKSSYMDEKREIFFENLDQERDFEDLVQELILKENSSKGVFDYLSFIKHKFLER